MSRGRSVAIIVVLATVLVAVILVYSYLPRTGSSGGPAGNPPGNNPQCRGSAACFTGTVAYIVDGDTLDVGSTRIRLALVNTPEVGQPGYAEAKEFTNQTCPVGTQAFVDEDDGQTSGSYGRMVALVFWQGTSLNAELLRTGNAVLVPDFCAVSEFARDAWTGCP